MKIYKIAELKPPVDPNSFKIEELGEQETEDFVNKMDLQHYNILREYYDKKRKKGTMMSWTVIPFDRLKKIWTDYARTGIVRDEKGMQAITDQMLDILARLNASNNLSGHGSMSNEDIEDITGYKMPHGKNTEFYFNFLETPYGSPVSDYGLPKLNKIAAALMMARRPIQQLMLVDQMLNVVHQRGDLSALFIEGGEASLNLLKNANSIMRIYKIAQANPWESSEEEFMDYHNTGYISESAYEKYRTPEGLNWLKKEKHPVLYSTKQFGNKTIEFRQSGEKNDYVKWVPNGNGDEDILRDSNGNAVMLSNEEIKDKGYPLFDTSIVAFDGDVAIGWVSDEFGADGVWVIDQYQRLGIGTYLLSEFRKQFDSSRKIGQMTGAGQQMARSYYRKFVNKVK